MKRDKGCTRRRVLKAIADKCVGANWEIMGWDKGKKAKGTPT